MENLWPETFHEEGDDFLTPKEILEQQAKMLPKLTGDIVHANIRQIEPMESFELGIEEGHLAYEFKIVGKFLEQYSFRAFVVSHDIGIYPLSIHMEVELAKEVKGQLESVLSQRIRQKFSVSNQEEFTGLLGQILKSNRIKKVINSIIKLSK